MMPVEPESALAQDWAKDKAMAAEAHVRAPAIAAIMRNHTLRAFH